MSMCDRVTKIEGGRTWLKFRNDGKDHLESCTQVLVDTLQSKREAPRDVGRHLPRLSHKKYMLLAEIIKSGIELGKHQCNSEERINKDRRYVQHLRVTIGLPRLFEYPR